MVQWSTVMKWNHARKGRIEGELVRDLGDFVDIELSKQVRLGRPDPMRRLGFRALNAKPGTIIRVRKSLLTIMEAIHEQHPDAD